MWSSTSDATGTRGNALSDQIGQSRYQRVHRGGPKGIPLADAAALPLVGLTAYQALFDHGKLTAGRRVLINGAAGGAVGGYAVQPAKNTGAHVIATASPRGSEQASPSTIPATCTRHSSRPWHR